MLLGVGSSWGLHSIPSLSRLGEGCGGLRGITTRCRRGVGPLTSQLWAAPS